MLGITAVLCVFNKALQFTKHFLHTPSEVSVPYVIARGWIDWTPMVSLALRSLDLNLHTSNFNWHSYCTLRLVE